MTLLRTLDDSTSQGALGSSISFSSMSGGKFSLKEAMDRFVIQKHRATHLHYDLRLEMDGVLKSWAVPKEPTMELGVKRLAIEVDDHSLDYIDFEGRIEEGNYGAGDVTIWDSGTYDLKRREKNLIVFDLYGNKLKGRFRLVKMNWLPGDKWLFIRGPAFAGDIQ